MENRECGVCHACCIHLPIGDKPAHVPCADLRDGCCQVYAERPDTCRRFRCFWLQGWLWPAARPDRCGVLLQPVVDHHGLRLNAIECEPEALERNPMIVDGCKFLPCWLVREYYLDGRVFSHHKGEKNA